MTGAGELGAWDVLSAVATGASHRLSDRPCQDAVFFLEAVQEGSDTTPLSAARASPVVVAVADGHGHRLHFRSQWGSLVAVQVACRVVTESGGALAAIAGAQEFVAAARQQLVPEILRRWQERVLADLDGRPVEAEELRAAGFVEGEWEGPDPIGDDPLLAYGTTLLIAAVIGRRLLLAQIGDGDIFTFGPAGATALPVPTDPALDGLRTTSLCQPDALDSFRLAAIDLDTTVVAGAVLTTDGYGNAQVAEQWQDAVGADLAGYLTTHTVDWVREQMPGWVANCASAEGSSDDTTMALLLAPEASRRRAEPPVPGAAAWTSAGTPAGRAPSLVYADRERTLPANPPAPEAPPAPEQVAGPPPPPPAGARRRWVWIGAGAVVAAAAVIAAVVAVTSGGGGSHPATAAPSTTVALPSAGHGDSGTQAPTTAPGDRFLPANDPQTGKPILVPLPSAVGVVTQDIQVGDDLAVLSGDEVWRVPVTSRDGNGTAHSDPLQRPDSDLRGLGPDVVTLTGKNRQVTYTIDLRTMAATCQAQPSARSAGAAGSGTTAGSGTAACSGAIGAQP